MKTDNENTDKNIQIPNTRYQSAVVAAIISGVFSLIIAALLFINYIQNAIVLPKQEERLDSMKVELRSKPDNEQLKLQIRQLDLKIRRERIRSWDFTRKGSLLLFGSVVVVLVGAKCAATFKKKVSIPRLTGDRRGEQLREAQWARWVLTIALVVLGSGSLIFITRPTIDFSAVGAEAAIYPLEQEIGINWPCFRGPGGMGISAYTNIPVKWNGQTGEGILWKTLVPLPGHNSPIVWQDRVFLSGADASNRQVYCFDAFSGKLLWTGSVINVPQGSTELAKEMKEAGFAAPTVVTDGRRVCAIFANGDVGCFDFNGKRLWAKNLGFPDSPYGYASSLAMYQNLLLIQYDQGDIEDGKSKMIALNTSSGKLLWETKRPVGSSWASPIVVKIGDQYQLVACANPWVISYNPIDGKELWRAKCLGGDIAPSPIYAGGFLFAIEPYTKFVAIKPDGYGDVTRTHIAYSIEESTPDICSPVANGELIFLLTSDGLLSCYKATDGTKLWNEELRENFCASPSLVGNNLYLLSEEGIMFIAEFKPKYKEIARCELGEKCFASPAFMDGRIYIRGERNLYCIGSEN